MIAEFAKRLEETEQERKIPNVIARCRPLLEFGLFPDSAPADAFKGLLERGLVVEVSHLGVEALQLAAGAFLLRKVYKDMFLWGDTKRLRLAIVLDEAHRLAKDVTLPKIMKEGRKYGIVVVASQGLDDFHPDVVGNAGTKIVFRTNYPMSKRVAGFLRAPKGLDLPAAIEQLDVGETFLQTPDMSVCNRSRMHQAAPTETCDFPRCE
jgi:DNA helicase HerA-like ATPase